MSKRKFLIPLATLSLLFSTLVACNNGGGSESKPGKSSDAGQSSQNDNSSQNQGSSQQGTSSQQGGSSSQQGGSSSQQGTSSQQQSHEHEYELVGTAAKNADGKDVSLYECKNHDDKYIAMAFGDFASKNEDFDSAAKASKYGEVEASLWDDAVMFAKTKTFAISWKFNVDKAISGAKLEFGLTSTYASHGNTSFADKYLVKVNDGAFASWEATGTYTENGLAPTKRTYVTFKTIDLAAGENTITIQQNNTENRLLFGGEMRVHYNSDAKPVTPEVPFAGYNVTFTTEHCKVLVYEGKKYDQTPVETNTTKAMDEDGNIVPYDVEDELPQPQVNFKVVPDDGYTVNATNITVTGKYKNLKQNPAKAETPAVDDDSIFRITKVQEDLAVSIVAVQGQQAKGYKVTFVPTNCQIKVYVGPKNEAGDNLDTPEDGVYYAREKDGEFPIGFTTPQVNFEVVCDSGYEFVPEIVEDKVNFISGSYNKFQEKNGIYNITKVASDLTITIAATQAQQPLEQPVGAFRGLAKGTDGTFYAVDMILAADSAQFYFNGQSAEVSSYVWDRTNHTLSVVANDMFGTISASFADNVFTITGITGMGSAMLDSTYVVKLSGNCQTLECEESTTALQSIFQRRKMGNSGWEAANADDKIFSSENGKFGKGLSVKCWADGKIALALKNDLNIPAKNIKTVGCWIYNPSSTEYKTTLYYYKAAGYQSNQMAKEFTLPAGQWTFCQCGITGLLADTDTFYNFQFYTQNVNTTLVFDNFCLYM